MVLSVPDIEQLFGDDVIDGVKLRVGATLS